VYEIVVGVLRVPNAIIVEVIDVVGRSAAHHVIGTPEPVRENDAVLAIHEVHPAVDPVQFVVDRATTNLLSGSRPNP
jgi:hypothetical protein